MRFCWWFIWVSRKQTCGRSTSELIRHKVQSCKNKKRTVVPVKPSKIWQHFVAIAKKSSFWDGSTWKNKTSRLKLKFKALNLILKEFKQWAWIKNDHLIQKHSAISWWRAIRSIRSFKDDDLITCCYQTSRTCSHTS